MMSSAQGLFRKLGGMVPMIGIVLLAIAACTMLRRLLMRAMLSMHWWASLVPSRMRTKPGSIEPENGGQSRGAFARVFPAHAAVDHAPRGIEALELSLEDGSGSCCWW